MKVTIEFNDYQGDDPVDLESTFDRCEFSTPNAGSYRAWGSAVHGFIATSGSRFNHEKILIEALLICAGHGVNWPYFVDQMSDFEAGKLSKALAARKPE